MILNVLLSLLSFLSLIISALVCGYYWILAAASLFNKKKENQPADSKLHTFAIIIPAHNEEKNIQKTIGSCRELDYPGEAFEIHVIADNCTDRTADIARSNGVACHERKDSDNRGKGFALGFAFDKLLGMGFDAYLVIDADCIIDPNALTTVNKQLSRGIKSLQINNVVSNPDASLMSYTLAVGNYIENELFYAGKSRMGLSVFLRGTGMVLHRDVLAALPWNAYSAAEDVDYSLNLIRGKIKTQFLKNARVESEFPVSKEQMNVQRTRWADGNIGFGKTIAANMIIRGIKGSDWLAVDAGWTLLILSRPLVLCQLFSTFIITLITLLVCGNAISAVLFSGAVSVALLQFLYFALGVLLMGLSMHRLKMLLKTPIILLRLIKISMKSLFSSGNNKWERTPR